MEIMTYCVASAAQTNFPSQASLSGISGKDFSKSEVIFSAVTLQRIRVVIAWMRIEGLGRCRKPFYLN